MVCREHPKKSIKTARTSEFNKVAGKKRVNKDKWHQYELQYMKLLNLNLNE